LIPLARFASKEDAELAKSRVNISTAIVSDEEFHSTLPSRRISKIVIAGADLVLTDFNRNENIGRRIEDLSAVVLGLLRSFRTTTFEKRGIGKRSTVTDETSDGRDALILDLHFRSGAVPFTVHSTGFDFSMLGAERSMIVSENFDRLFFRLCELAPRALVVKDHDRLRNHLRGPWPETVRTDGLGRVQTGFAQRRYGRSSSLDNTLQFTKFSRLQALELDEL
jgi:hypothetical protein